MGAWGPMRVGRTVSHGQAGRVIVRRPPLSPAQALKVMRRLGDVLEGTLGEKARSVDVCMYKQYHLHSMNETIDGFDWDAGNREKCVKHGVSITEIEEVLAAQPHVAPDPGHSDAESRFIAIGHSEEGRAMFIAFTLRTVEGRRLIRPISARYMHAKEIERYDARHP